MTACDNFLLLVLNSITSTPRVRAEAGPTSIPRRDTGSITRGVGPAIMSPTSKDSSTTHTNADTTTTLGTLLIDISITLATGALASSLLYYYQLRLRREHDLEERSNRQVQSSVRSTRNALLKERAAQNNVHLSSLSVPELQIADSIIDPTHDIDCSFADIGGLDAIKEQIFGAVLAPLYFGNLYTSSRLRSTPRGILLYGRPGTGKTMLAKCMAKEAQALLIHLKGSTLLNKYWGESNKIVRAAFDLAHKLRPCILFVDEMDNFLRNGGTDAALMDTIKAEFLALWEGISTTEDSKVLVVGATNRPDRIDGAILRRMPLAIELPLPNTESRLDILRKMLRDENCHPSVVQELPDIASATEGYSGSDLHEVCKHAANIAVNELTQDFATRRVQGESVESIRADQSHVPTANDIRPLHANDLRRGMEAIRPTGEAAAAFGQKQRRESASNGAYPMDDSQQLQVQLLLQALLKQLVPNGHSKQTEDNDDDLPQM